MPTLHSARPLSPRRRRWHIVQGLFFIFVFGLAAFVFLQSSFFQVRSIQVLGSRQLTRDEVVALAGLAKGVNIFKADLRQAQDKIALHPMVKEVSLDRKLPSTVIINVTERRPIGLIAAAGGYTVVSEDGRVLGRRSSLVSVNLPFITGVNPGSAGPGQKITDEKLPDALVYLLAMPLSLQAAVSEINVADRENIRIFTMDRAEVRFGDGERAADKIKLYQEVISRKYPDKILYIDISYKGSPVIKFDRPPGPEAKPKPQP